MKLTVFSCVPTHVIPVSATRFIQPHTHTDTHTLTQAGVHTLSRPHVHTLSLTNSHSHPDTHSAADPEGDVKVRGTPELQHMQHRFLRELSKWSVSLGQHEATVSL